MTNLIREDLIGAKAYKIGYKAVECGDRYFTTKIVKTYDEAIVQLNKWKDNGWKTIILPVK